MATIPVTLRATTGAMKKSDVNNSTRSKDQRNHIMNVQSEEMQTTLKRILASKHLSRREFAEFAFVYESILARHPDNTNDKNTLAWFLLKSPDKWYRDTVRAQNLAEEAVARDPRSQFVDTLAEACYQNGNFQRAVELEEQALASAESDKLPAQSLMFFRTQLDKFRKAAVLQTASK